MEKNCTNCKYFNEVTGTHAFDGFCTHTKHVGRFATKSTLCSEYEYDTRFQDVIGIIDTETNGKKFAVGTKNHSDTFVLNFSDMSCLLFFGDCQPIDLRKFNFDEFTSIEINGNKFVREKNYD